MDAGIRTFDTAVGGLGGCPFAPGASGNIATEDAVYLFDRMGIATGIDMGKLMLAGDIATGLPGAAIVAVWGGLRRRETEDDAQPSRALQRVFETYDLMAVDRAQTVLRYWNWSLSSALTPALMRAIRAGDEAALDPFSTPQRAAMLALGADFAR